LCLKVFNYDFDPIAKIDQKKIGTKGAKKGAGMQDSFFCKELPYRVSGEEAIYARIFYFISTPIIKYVVF
jgi:hypothetical protein